MTDLLTKTRKINTLLQQKNTFDMQADLPYDKMAVTLGGILDSNKIGRASCRERV